MTQAELFPSGGATFSDDGVYRYHLWRTVRGNSGNKSVGFILLNPSTADEFRDDPTIRRCIGFAQAWGYRRIEIVNLFAYRSTNPKALWTVSDPVGDPDNWDAIRDVASEADIIVCAWGAAAAGDHMHARASYVVHQLRQGAVDLYCLRETKDGRPAHPLYLPKTLTPNPFGGSE